MPDTFEERALTHFVGGSWRVPYGARMQWLPGGLGVVLAEARDCARALRCAEAAQAGWQATDAGERVQMLTAMGQAAPTLGSAFLRGVALAVTAMPAPAPAFGAAGRDDDLAAVLGAHLKAGRTVIAVPPPMAPLALLELALAAQRSALPPGVFNLLQGIEAEMRAHLVR